MRGYNADGLDRLAADAAQERTAKWDGQLVNYNGTKTIGQVIRAVDVGVTRPVKLIVDWLNDDLLPYTTDSEHVTIVPTR